MESTQLKRRKRRIVSVKIDNELYEKINEFANNNGLSMSAVMRTALNKYIDENYGKNIRKIMEETTKKYVDRRKPEVIEIVERIINEFMWKVF